MNKCIPPHPHPGQRKKDKEIGSVEPGKFADLIVINGDPLANIRNTRNIETVVLNGKVIDRTLDPNWKNPIPRPDTRPNY